METRVNQDIKVADTASYFAESVFNDRIMRTRLSRQTYLALKETIERDAPLDSEIAAEVAVSMKQWAIEKGATHFTHWFMPLTGSTAEKHDAFIDNLGDGQVILNFSAKALIKGEPDASSFPTGGLRETAAARGYTAWDCTSPAFVKDGTLYIPTAFYSYTGEVLDKKAPLLRANQILSQQALRLLHAIGETGANKVVSDIGPEQEYFLVDREHYLKRPDLIYCGRTLFGAPAPKGQELSDSYYASIHPRVLDFMQELDRGLWRLGITAKTRHNEVAPTQHELAIIFDQSNVSADHNMLVMELMTKIARHHGFECLLHEKPYASLSGSGKHINWSLATDTGINLFNPGNNPCENWRFLLFLCAVIAAVDRYGRFLTCSVASPSNEHRLGSQEAPPAILSIAVGEELQEILEAIKEGRELCPRDRASTNLGVRSMSISTVDTTDRNRTSPFAFTGNRFEFRMCGSMMNVAEPTFYLNAFVAKIFGEFADRLEGAVDVKKEAYALMRAVMKEHGRILYGGDNYDPKWAEEAKRRGLPVVTDMVEAIALLKDPELVALFRDENVLTEMESAARHDVLMDYYAKINELEARTALDMCRRLVKPAVLRGLSRLSAEIQQSGQAGLKLPSAQKLLNDMAEAFEAMCAAERDLDAALQEEGHLSDLTARAQRCRKISFGEMPELRRHVDALENIVPADLWPMPSYRELLYQK